MGVFEREFWSNTPGELALVWDFKGEGAHSHGHCARRSSPPPRPLTALSGLSVVRSISRRGAPGAHVDPKAKAAAAEAAKKKAEASARVN